MHAFKHLALAALLSASATVAQAELVYGITTDGRLGSFDSGNAGNVTFVGAITGLNAGDTLRGIDFRPSDGQLYAMSTNAAGTTAHLYTLNLSTGVATAIGAGITLTGNSSTRVSLDFNPVANALRVVTGSGQSYRVNANTGVLIAQDTNISGNPLISGIAYTNNVVGATQTTLYAYDFLRDNVGTIGGINGMPSPNTGVFNTVGNSGIVIGNAGSGFDISGVTGIGYFSGDDFNGTPDSEPEFFSVNLGTGAFTKIGDFGSVDMLDFSVAISAPTRVSAPGTLSLAALGLWAAGALRRRRAS